MIWFRALLGIVLSTFACAVMSQQQDPERTLRVGMGPDKPPYVILESGRGLDVDLVRGALAGAGYRVETVHAPQERIYLMFRNGELDAVAATHADSGLPAYYSDAYINYSNVAVSLERRQLAAEHVEDLINHSVVAFQRASKLLGARFEQMSERNPRYHEVALPVQRNLMLYAGRVDYVITEERIFRTQNASIAGQVDITQPIRVHRVLAPTAYSMAFADAEVRDRFNRALRQLRSSGQYAEIMHRYGDPLETATASLPAAQD